MWSGEVLLVKRNYDIADETQHVRFGKRWLPELLKHVGEKRSLEQYTEDVLKVWEKHYKTGLLPINAKRRREET